MEKDSYLFTLQMCLTKWLFFHKTAEMSVLIKLCIIKEAYDNDSIWKKNAKEKLCVIN